LIILIITVKVSGGMEGPSEKIKGMMLCIVVIIVLQLLTWYS